MNNSTVISPNITKIKPTKNFTALASDDVIAQTKAALEQHNITVLVAENGEEAKTKVLELIPKGAEVLTMTSITADTIGLTKELNESGNYNAIRPQLMKMDRTTQGREMRKMGTAPDYATGSVHAVTREGAVLIASATGSQLSAYAGGAGHVIWIVGTQKIVTDEQEGLQRIYEHSLPLESERAHKAYGAAGSSVNKILTVKQEATAGRITVIFVKELLGF